MGPAGPDDTDLSSLVLRGGRSTETAELRKAIEDAQLVNTIDGASTLTLTVNDRFRKLVRSPLLVQRTTCTLQDRLFELVRTRKRGSVLDVEFEDAAVADLRRVVAAGAVTGGTTTRVGYATRIVAAPGWLRIVSPPGPAEQVPFGSGNDKGDEPGWDALHRLFVDDLRWRRFAQGRDVTVAPDPWLYARRPPAVLREHTGGVDDIDFDVDTGKLADRATLTCLAGRWSTPPGSPVELPELGPASGSWLVETVKRGLFSRSASIELTRIAQPLPPPPVEPRDERTTTSTAAAAGGDRFTWPVEGGRLSSPFGPRGGRVHAGIDLAVPIGTAVLAAADGTVEVAGTASGYGTVVYLSHAGDLTSRYAHLSRLEVRRGQQVRRGDRIALSGNTGNSTGPHLHFEIRTGGRAVDPLPYLPSRR
jgi:hypothetical protein